MDPRGAQITAWAPSLAGITEVFHADFVGHAYPKHTHDQWSLMLVDRGTIAYDLDHRAHGAAPEIVTLLPPGIAHDGVPVTEAGFRQRILYLDTSVLGEVLIGPAVDSPRFETLCCAIASINCTLHSARTANHSRPKVAWGSSLKD